MVIGYHASPKQYAQFGALVALVVVGGIYLTALVASVQAYTSSNTTSASPTTQQITPNSYIDSDSNAVTGGLSHAIYEIQQATKGFTRATGRYAQAAQITTTQAAIKTADTIQLGVTTTAHSMATIATYVIRVPNRAVGSLAGISNVGDVIRPEDTTQIPVIETGMPASLAGASVAPMTSASADSGQPADHNDALWPLHGDVTTLFGVPHWPFQPTHTGLDISSGRASGVMPIHPYKPGTVLATIPASSGSGLGNHVIVDHGGGLTTVYAHLASITVTTEQQVDHSTILGYEGATGAVTGTHLHFEVRLNGQPVNPQDYIAGRP